MSLIYAGPVNRSRSVCRFFHPIQGVVVIFLSSYFFTTLVFIKVKRHRDLYKLLWLEVKILNFYLFEKCIGWYNFFILLTWLL